MVTTVVGYVCITLVEGSYVDGSLLGDSLVDNSLVNGSDASLLDQSLFVEGGVVSLVINVDCVGDEVLVIAESNKIIGATAAVVEASGEVAVESTDTVCVLVTSSVV